MVLLNNRQLFNFFLMTVHRKNAPQTIADLNAEILKKFLANQDNTEVRKTHLFEGRYENIYLSEQQIPELTLLMTEATTLAEGILKNEHLRAGFWFNYMPPGSATLMHSHDDYDELLSGVYYINVPENSGNLIIYDTADNNQEEKIEIEPHTGEFIFFRPDVRHEVSRNNSDEHRLSIGINFGVDK
jgi:Putative 2OG-Fe(II) oxygenase